jgi:hypothetical protein
MVKYSPNRAFRDRNKPDDIRVFEMRFSSPIRLELTCANCNCFIEQDYGSLHTFRPSLIICDNCGENQWNWKTIE